MSDSDSDSLSENDYSTLLDDTLLKQEESGIKLEKDSEENIDAEEGDKKPTASELSKSAARKLRKQKRKLQQIKEEQLREDVFGNKEKYLKTLAIQADGAKKAKLSSKKRQPVWNDDDDTGVDVITRVDNYKPEVTKKEVYKKQLENKFQRILGTPAWADLNRKNADKDDSDDEILQTVGHLAHSKSERLPSGTLDFKRLKDLNRETYCEGPSITDVVFHPGSTVCLVTGTRGIATIYSIDGKKNDKLHSMAFKNYPIRCCRLNRDGTEAIFGGSQKYIYTYNLMSGHTQRIFLPKTMTKMSSFEVSPCGKYIAVIGRFGGVHLLFASTAELLCTLQQEHDATSLTFSHDSRYLFAHSDDCEVNIYDIGEQRCIHRFVDDGCINGSTIAISPNSQLLAASSKQGVVNVYNYDDVFTSKLPKPQKTILNLTTAVSSTTFNHSSELLAIASKEVEESVKIVHFPSGTVYSNFPGMHSNIGRPNVVRFSPKSGFLAIGNNDTQVPLYRLKHFNDY